MLIKSITINNFRQFIGENKISFSTDPEKKATLILAENGSGKTTLLEAFSWAFYGSCGLKSIKNQQLIDKMIPGEDITISVIVNLIHQGVEYEVKRWAYMKKSAKTATVNGSVVVVSFKDEDGQTKELRNQAANEKVSEIMPKDLFPYFFFQGESVEKIGSEIASGDDNRTFENAVKGMLGLNWLYNAKNDLKKLNDSYDTEIALNSTNAAYKQNQQDIIEDKETIESEKTKITNIETNISNYKRELDAIKAEILKCGDVSDKQKQYQQIENELNKINYAKTQLMKDIFTAFSKKSYLLFASEIFPSVKNMVDSASDANKGIPGMQVSAIKYLQESGTCICGEKLVEGDAHWQHLNELIKYLPPNNLGANIKVYENEGEHDCDESLEYVNTYRDQRRRLNSYEEDFAEKKKQAEIINEEIKNFPDMTKKKEREQELNSKLSSEQQSLGKEKNILERAQSDLELHLRKKATIEENNEKVIKLVDYQWYVKKLISKIETYCGNKETEKRIELQEAINEIFKDVFNMDVHFELTEHYQLKMILDKYDEGAESFENSTSQDAILAFSFIGGIIKLAKQQANGNLQDEDELDKLIDTESDVEPYPLVMDAPSSSFDTDRIEKFCEIMPNIAEQVIFMIKDTDGLYVKKNIQNIIGKEYTLVKLGNYETQIKEIN